ncbi:MAG: hypothetical protein WCR01_05600 [Bacteroidota bacterium]
MKKFRICLIFLLTWFANSGCNKLTESEPLPTMYEMNFNIRAGLSPGGLKDTPGCINENTIASYVEVTLLKQGDIAPSTVKINVYYINGQPYTNSIKLLPATYEIQEFIMRNDNNTPDNFGDDPVIAAAVHEGAPYANLVTSWLTKDFSISPYKKNMMEVELVCYDEANFTSFGFEYFKLDQTVIREQHFFGDLCIRNAYEYYNSPYSQLLGGNANLLLDLPAIFQVEVLRNGISTGTFNNNSITGISEPLKVQYADRLAITDNFEFKLSAMVRSGVSFQYQYLHSWNFQDSEKIQAGTDGVVDFGIGNCNPDADLVLPPVVVPDCEISKPNGGGFTTTIQSVVCTNNSYRIVLRVEHDGCGGSSCKELSHFSVEADPGTYSNVIAEVISGPMTYNHNIVMGPNLGNSTPFQGFKIDNTKKIGDGNAGIFTVSYTLTTLQDQQVLAKAGTSLQMASFTLADFTSVMNCNHTGCK